MNRRDFITLSMRYLLLAILGAISIFAITRKQAQTDASCTAGNLCQSCNKSSGCSLPQKL